MKKLTIAAAALLMLTACGSSTKTGKAEKEIENHGKAETVTVEVTLDGDKVTEISFDETYQGSTKKTLKEDYNMKGTSPIGKEWYEQVDALEKYIVENGIDAVELDENGYPVAGSDLATECTIDLTNLMATAEEAVNNAK